jgi:hypothetical protein
MMLKPLTQVCYMNVKRIRQTTFTSANWHRIRPSHTTLMVVPFNIKVAHPTLCIPHVQSVAYLGGGGAVVRPPPFGVVYAGGGPGPPPLSCNSWCGGGVWLVFEEVYGGKSKKCEKLL